MRQRTRRIPEPPPAALSHVSQPQGATLATHDLPPVTPPYGPGSQFSPTAPGGGPPRLPGGPAAFGPGLDTTSLSRGPTRLATGRQLGLNGPPPSHHSTLQTQSNNRLEVVEAFPQPPPLIPDRGSPDGENHTQHPHLVLLIPSCRPRSGHAPQGLCGGGHHHGHLPGIHEHPPRG